MYAPALFLAFLALVSANLIDVAEQQGLTVLVSSIFSQGLDTTLNGTGPFTLFGPTDNAFGAVNPLPSGQALTDTLLYHVLAANVTTADITTNDVAQTTQYMGYPVFVKEVSGVFYVNGVPISSADIQASNGVLQVIGELLYPLPTGTIVQTAEANTALYSTFIDYVNTANLYQTLNDTNAIYTAFIPTDAAFNNVAPCVAAYLAANSTALSSVLTYHVLGANAVFSSQMVPGDNTYTTLDTTSLTVNVNGAVITINGVANITTANQITINGVIHTIDAVLFPPGFPAQSEIQGCGGFKIPAMLHILLLALFLVLKF